MPFHAPPASSPKFVPAPLLVEASAQRHAELALSALPPPSSESDSAALYFRLALIIRQTSIEDAARLAPPLGRLPDGGAFYCFEAQGVEVALARAAAPLAGRWRAAAVINHALVFSHLVIGRLDKPLRERVTSAMEALAFVDFSDLLARREARALEQALSLAPPGPSGGPRL